MQKEILKKAASFCAYQERTQQEVRQRLKEWGVVGNEAEELIATLITENFINEERFAKIFAGGKFRTKKWGRVRIIQELKQRGLSANNLKTGLAEIDEAEYRRTLQRLIDKKSRDLTSDDNPLALKQKVARYVISKGYEPDLVWEMLRLSEHS